jgi:uncharacterized protein (DUF2336 family)
MSGLLQKILSGLLGDKLVDYEEAKNLAASADSDMRKKLAENHGIKPEFLYYLAGDPSPEVRRTIASNPSTPAQANMLLAKDADERVRADLARKITALAPGLGPDEQDRIRRMTYETLEMLARDQLPKVRQIIAETLKDVANAPPEVMRRLARDSEIIVAAPVLEYSPVLSDEDLLEIIGSSPIKGALSAISRRIGVGGQVVDAISQSDDIEAITVLLGNKSAQIREETLDRLIERAPDIEMWHAPLVQRPHLSARAVGRIARFVADNLLEVLKTRKDLDPQTMEEVARVVHMRIENDTSQADLRQSRKGQDKGKGQTGPAPDPLEPLRKLHRDGKLEEVDVGALLSSGKLDSVTGAIAVRTSLPIEVVRKAIETQSAKGMTALAFKAGFTMAFAQQLQSKLAHVPPSSIIKARGKSYPITADEADWQIGFFKSLVADSKR